MLVVPWSLALCALTAIVAAFTDLRSRTIPNWLTLPLPVLGILGHSLTLGLDAVWASVLGCLFCFGPAFFLFARGALGGGDVKLFTGLGALLGPREGLEVQLTAFGVVALYALWTTAWDGRLGALLRSSCHATLHLIAPARFARPSVDSQESMEVPMGLGISLAVFALCLRSWL